MTGKFIIFNTTKNPNRDNTKGNHKMTLQYAKCTFIFLNNLPKRFKKNNIKEVVEHFVALFDIFAVPINCLVGKWSSWSQPDEGGKVESFRSIRRKSLNGGMKCPEVWRNKKGS